MADALDIQHKIRLDYEEHIRSSISEHLESLQKQLNQINKTFKSHHKGVGSSSSAAKGASKSYKNFSKAAGGAGAKMGGLSKVAFSAGKALGVAGMAAGVAFTALSKLGSIALSIVDLGNSMTQFAAKSGVGASAVLTLRKAYWDMSAASGAANISLQDLTKSMSDFASLGFPQQMMASEESMISAVGTMQDSLTKALGDKSAGKALSDSLFKATSGDLPIMEEFRDAINATHGDIGKMAVVMKDVRFSQLDDSAFRTAAGAIDILVEKSQGGVDGAVSAFTSWGAVMNTFQSAITNVGDVLLKTFGGEMATIMDSAQEMLVSFIGNMSEWGGMIQGIWVVIKTVAHNNLEVWKMSWNAVIGVVQLAIAGMSMSIGKLMSWLPGELGKSGEAMLAWGKDVGKAGIESLKAVANPKFLSVQDELEDHFNKQSKQLNQKKKKIEDVVKALDPEVSRMRELRDEVLKILPQLESWGKSLDKSAKLTDSLAKMTALVGSQYKVMGQDIGNVTMQAAQSQIGLAKALLDQASDAQLAKAQEIITHYEKQVALGDHSAATAKSLGEAQSNLATMIDSRTKAYEKLQGVQESYTADLKADLVLTEKGRKLSQARLAVTQAVYGTPALAVSASMAVVKQMEQEKNLIAEMFARQKQLVAEMEAQGVEASELQFAQEKLLDLQTQHTEKTAEQLNMLKELRDGYLDAVQSQAFGAGRFSKILITQDKNVMRGLNKRIAKENYLLGVTGKAARADKANAMRFSDSKLGLETMGGQEVTPEMAAEEQKAREAGMSGRQAAAAAQANVMTTGIVSGADKNTLEIINSQAKGAELIKGAIGEMATRGTLAAGGVAGLKGTKAGETAIGEALRTGNKGPGFPQGPVIPSGVPVVGPPAPVTPRISGGAKTGISAGGSGKGGGNMQSRMKIAIQVLMELARGMDIMKEDINNTTEYTANRGRTPNNQP